jgi:transposase
VKIEKDPNSNTRKQVMIDWLVERNITHDTTHTKPELYGIIKQHKTRNPRYKLDTLLHEHGHNVLRLPPYHPEFNPIEKIWAIVKNWVAARNTTFKMADVEDLARQKFDSVTSETWFSVCEHVDKFVDEYMVKEHIIDHLQDEMEFMVNTGDSDDESSICSESDDDYSDVWGIEPFSD